MRYWWGDGIEILNQLSADLVATCSALAGNRQRRARQFTGTVRSVAGTSAKEPVHALEIKIALLHQAEIDQQLPVNPFRAGLMCA